MQLKIYSEPAIEPVSLQEIKEHLRLDSGAFGDNLTTTQVIAPGQQAVTEGYALLGAYVDVLGVSAIMALESGTAGAGATVDVKIQESNDHLAWTDWSGGSFTQVTTANDNAIQKISYTGGKQYIRCVARILVSASSFGVSCLTYSSDATDDAQLAMAITAARQEVESYTRRSLITQTWDMSLDAWPTAADHEERWRRNSGEIILPFGRLQSVTSVAYTDDQGASTTLTATTEYLVDPFSEPGRLVLPTDGAWPTEALYPVNPIMIRFVCGYGATAASVPAGLRAVILMLAADLYENREAQLESSGAKTLTDNKAVVNLLGRYRMRSFG